MPSRSARQCRQRSFNPPELQTLLTCNLDLMPALRTRVCQQDASTGASLDAPHTFFTWKSCPLAQQWVTELPHHTLPLGGYPGAQSRALGTSSPASGGWHGGTRGSWRVLVAGRHGVEAARSTASEKWVRTANKLPAFALSSLCKPCRQTQ